jgi:hypothetical protein
MSNVKLHYLYRDGSNYKKWAEIVFSGTDGLSIESATEGLRAAFLPDGLFVAHQVRIPEVFLAAEDQLTSDDHCFHEFDSVEATSDTPDDRAGRTIRDFMAEVAEEAERGWCAFNPQDRLPQRRRRFPSTD